MGAYVLSIAERGSAGNTVACQGHETMLTCLRGTFAVKYIIVEEFLRGDIHANL